MSQGSMSYSGRPPRLSPQLRNEPSYWKAIEELKLNKYFEKDWMVFPEAVEHLQICESLKIFVNDLSALSFHDLFFNTIRDKNQIRKDYPEFPAYYEFGPILRSEYLNSIAKIDNSYLPIRKELQPVHSLFALLWICPIESEKSFISRTVVRVELVPINDILVASFLDSSKIVVYRHAFIKGDKFDLVGEENRIIEYMSCEFNSGALLKISLQFMKKTDDLTKFKAGIDQVIN